MRTYERVTRVDAPLDAVWDFHSTTAGLEVLTPTALGLRVESVVGPDGTPNPEPLERGSRIELSIHPGRIGPRLSMTSEIVDRDRDDRRARFRDEMIDGPFERWVHTHVFLADGDGTIVRDHVEYALPGTLGALVESVSRLGLAAMFRDRHRRTRKALEAHSRRRRAD